MYHGVLTLLGLCGDMVISVWNYHVLSVPGHVRFWNRNQNYGVDHTYVRLVVRFQNIFDSVSKLFFSIEWRSYSTDSTFQVRRHPSPERDIWYILVQSFPYNGRFHLPYGILSQLLYYGYLSRRKRFFDFVCKLVYELAFRSVIANSVGFVSSNLISSYLAASMRIIWNISCTLGFSKLNVVLMRKVKFLLNKPGNNQEKNKEKWC